MRGALAGWRGGLLVMSSIQTAAQEPVRLYAPGSLRVALTEVTGAVIKASDVMVARD
jgi:molybdopterin-binding protein